MRDAKQPPDGLPLTGHRCDNTSGTEEAQYIVPRAITLWEAASPPASESVVLVGFLIFMPFVLAYTALSYRVFRGKVQEKEGYS